MQVRCPGCDTPFRIAEEHRTLTVRCPTCGMSLRAPRASARAPAGPGPAPRRRTLRGRGRTRRRCPNCNTFVPDRVTVCRICGAPCDEAQPAAERERRDAFAPERAGMRAGVLGGIIMIAIAVVWFFLGLQAGFIFFYPPVLALIGVAAIVKGLLEGNLAGRRRRPDPTRGFWPADDPDVD